MTSTEFIAAVKSGDLDTVNDALRGHPDLIKSEEGGVSALMLAVYYGHYPVADAIAGAREGDLDIFEAVLMGYEKAVERMVEADPGLIEKRSADGFTPLQFACYFGKKEVAEALVRKGAQVNVLSENSMKVAPLHSALAGGHIEIARMLLANGADAGMQAGEGWTPLHYAADIGDAEIAKELIAKGARGGVPNENGVTAEQLGVDVGHGHVSEVIRTAQ